MKLKRETGVGIEVKEAVRLAKEFASSLLDSEKISNLGLEAVERTEDGQHWLVTLGFSRPWASSAARRTESPLDQVLPFRGSLPDREYKVFKVDAESGDVVAMQVFEV